MADTQEFEKSLKRLIRRVDQESLRGDQSDGNRTIDLGKSLGNIPLSDLVSDSLFAIGMGIVGLFTIMIAVMVSEKADKVMFGCFALVCLLVSAYKIDKTTRHLRRSDKS